MTYERLIEAASGAFGAGSSEGEFARRVLRRLHLRRADKSRAAGDSLAAAYHERWARSI